MSKRDKDTYLAYKERAPFMFPIPKFIASLVTVPIRVLLGKNQPENRKEMIGTFVVYFVIFVLLSLPFILLNFPPDHQWWKWPVWPIGPGPIFELARSLL